jgi:gliding motility-associated-like protein
MNTTFGGNYFEENKGQWNSDVLFKTHYAGGDVYICNDKIVYSLYDAVALNALHGSGEQVPDSIKRHAIVVTYSGSNSSIIAEGLQPFTDYSNYFVGHESNWRSNVHHYNKVKLHNIYNGIDLEFFYKNGSLKYNFIVDEPKSATQIKLTYQGAEKVYLSKGEVHIRTSLGEIIEKAPISYGVGGQKIETAYILEGNTLGFIFPDELTRTQRRNTVLIDPELIFSTYSGSVADNFGYTATYDTFGNGYAGGIVYGFGYPTTIGAFQTLFKGSVIDIAISKYTLDGKSRIYATYIGGIGEDHPHSMVVNSKNELVVMGSTSSIDFPTTSQAYDRVINNNINPATGKFDIFLFKLNAFGTALTGSTFIGGDQDDGLNGNNSTNNPIGTLINNYADNFRGEVIVDSLDNIYVASSTKSANFPYKGGSSSTFTGTQNAIIFKMNSGLSELSWSTFWGQGECSGYGLAFGNGNALFVVGGITQNGLITSASKYQSTFQSGKFDGYIANINKLTGIGISSYLGTVGDDQAYLVQTDQFGRPYVFGQTTGAWPISTNTYQNPGSGQFIIRLDPDLTAFDKSMVFGSGTTPANISPSAFLVDRCDRIFVSGWGGTTNSSYNGGSTQNMPTTPDAIQLNTEGSDFYLAVFSKNLEELLYGTYFGGTGPNNQEHVDGGTSRFDKKGVIYQSVCASCNSSNSGFPTTIDAWSRTNKGKRPWSNPPSPPPPGCNNALFKIDFESFNRQPLVRDSFFKVTATENLSFLFEASDPDKYDSLFMRITSDFDTFTNTATKPSIIIQNDIAKASLLFNWTPNCDYISSDTYSIKVGVYDQGCPTTDSNFAEIKILVEAPPLAPNPDIICIKFDANNVPEISWEAFGTNAYAKSYRLMRRSPNGNVSTLKNFTSNAAGDFKETVGPDYTKNDYCYYFISENICGMQQTSAARACTVKEFTNPIPGENIVLVTVEQDENIKIVWNRSDESDFGGYRIFRKRDDGQGETFKAVGYIDQINDTSFIDQNVLVDDHSYCYYVIVEDDCGNKSLPQDTSCSILLKGVEWPFYFTHSSNPYIYWPTGVKEYELWSKVDTGLMRYKQTLAAPNGQVQSEDHDLDYNWGGYNYQYRAYNITNDTTPSRISLSNSIYLIQPPLLHVPSAFSPNGDGRNDDWGIVDVFVKTYQILVFNRWGEKVYDSEDKYAQWNGVYKGDDQNDNVYVWIAYYTGWDERKYSQKGNVTVIK